MLSVPRQKAVRGYSFYGFSFVYVIFEDGTDPYWARSRVLEYLSGLSGQLPKGVTPSLGPDATGVGWAFMYSINSTNRDLAELRSISGLVSEISTHGRGRRVRSRVRRRLREAIPGDGGPDEAARLQPFVEGREHGHRAQQRRVGGPFARTVRARIHPARQGLRAKPGRFAEGRRGFRRERRADFVARRGQRCSSVPTCGAASPN
jgi:hypothetical protein